MSVIVTLLGSPQSPSRTEAVLSHVVRRLSAAGHEIRPLVLRDLPAGPLLAADVSDPEIAAAVELVSAADAVVIASPVYKAAYSGLLKVFLDLLPQFALRGKDVLPLVTGGSPAHVLAVDYALRPVLASMGPAHIGPGWFVSSSHVSIYPDGGTHIDAVAAGPLHEVVDAFLHVLGNEPRRIPAPIVTTPGELTVKRVRVEDPETAPLLADLAIEYGTRYHAVDSGAELARFPAADFEDPNGAFLLLLDGEETVAGGAIRRYDDHTAEVKRVWTSPRHRRRGLARRVMEVLEDKARELGYSRIYLTTGPRQPEASGLYLNSGYTPLYDTTVDPETIGHLPFVKDLGAVGSVPTDLSTLTADQVHPERAPRVKVAV